MKQTLESPNMDLARLATRRAHTVTVTLNALPVCFFPQMLRCLSPQESARPRQRGVPAFADPTADAGSGGLSPAKY